MAITKAQKDAVLEFVDQLHINVMNVLIARAERTPFQTAAEYREYCQSDPEYRAALDIWYGASEVRDLLNLGELRSTKLRAEFSDTMTREYKCWAHLQ